MDTDASLKPDASPRIAIIGSGLAGLSAAYLLSVNGYTVDIYEKHESLGLASASVVVRGKKDGEDLVMDVPMRSFFPEHYSHLTALYKYLNIPYHTSENSISYSQYSAFQSQSQSATPKSSIKPIPYFSFSCYKIPFTSLSISCPDLPSPVRFLAGLYESMLSAIHVMKVVAGYLKFLVVVKYLAMRGSLSQDGPLKGVTLGQFWDLYGIGKEFAEGTFEPLFCGVCTCSREALRDFPAVVILDYAARAMPFGKMSFVSTGVHAVCEALTKPVNKIFLNTSVQSVHSTPTARIPTPPLENTSTEPPHMVVETSCGSKRHYHHVVFATQANQASKILKASQGYETDAEARQQTQILDQFVYAKSLVVCHTDEDLMPKDKGIWRCMNFFTPEIDGEAIVEDSDSSSTDNKVLPFDPLTTSSCSHWFNLSHPSLSPTSGPQYYQTTNPHALPSPNHIISTSHFERAVVTLSSLEALDSLDTVQGLGNRWFVGSYAWEGIPLLEGCVGSAIRVARGIKGEQTLVPWEAEKTEIREENRHSLVVAMVVAIMGIVGMVYYV